MNNNFNFPLLFSFFQLPSLLAKFSVSLSARFHSSFIQGSLFFRCLFAKQNNSRSTHFATQPPSITCYLSELTFLLFFFSQSNDIQRPTNFASFLKHLQQFTHRIKTRKIFYIVSGTQLRKFQLSTYTKLCEREYK